MNLLDELKCQLVSEANDIKTFIELNKCIGTIVMLDQMLMIKVAFLTVAFKGGHSNVAEQTHNELTKQNYKLIDDFFDAGMRRKYHMYEYRQELRTVNSIRRYWEHNAYIEISKLKTNNDFVMFLKKNAKKLSSDIETLIDINELFDSDFSDYFKEERWFKKCLM